MMDLEFAQEQLILVFSITAFSIKCIFFSKVSARSISLSDALRMTSLKNGKGRYGGFLLPRANNMQIT